MRNSESISMSIRSYTYSKNWLVNKLQELEKKQTVTRKKLDKEINDTKRQIKECELRITFLEDDLKSLSK